MYFGDSKWFYIENKVVCIGINIGSLIRGLL